jgi:hypothetical protein
LDPKTASFKRLPPVMVGWRVLSMPALFLLCLGPTTVF